MSISLILHRGTYVSKAIYHILHVNSFHSCLKRWMDRFQGVANKYMDYFVITRNCDSWFKCAAKKGFCLRNSNLYAGRAPRGLPHAATICSRDFYRDSRRHCFPSIDPTRCSANYSTRFTVLTYTQAA